MIKMILSRFYLRFFTGALFRPNFLGAIPICKAFGPQFNLAFCVSAFQRIYYFRACHHIRVKVSLLNPSSILVTLPIYTGALPGLILNAGSGIVCY